MESELFGHEKGAFTDAKEKRIGKFEEVNGGTLFFDEIGDMKFNIQAKMLRVLQDRKFSRLGSNKLLDADFRLICATNRDLGALIENGDFREDLFYRLSVISIHLPPLRQRKEDILLLADEFLQEFASLYNKKVDRLSSEVIDIFMKHQWPGNVRELRNIIERVVIFCEGEVVQPYNLPEHYASFATDEQKVKGLHDLEKTATKEIILEALYRSKGVKTKAADMLNISRKTLYNRMKQLNIE